MNLQQLHDFTKSLLAAGVPPGSAVCIPCDEEPYEISDVQVIKGPFSEDPSPKMCSFIQSEGVYTLLMTSDDYQWLVASRYQQMNSPEAPCKEWPPGEEWWNVSRRQRLAASARADGLEPNVAQNR